MFRPIIIIDILFSLSFTLFWTAACPWTTRAANVAAALLWTALTAANAQEQDEQQSTKDDQQDC